jgi:hypothetical protein
MNWALAKRETRWRLRCEKYPLGLFFCELPAIQMYKWCRGGELNSLRRPFQGRALPVSYPGTGVKQILRARKMGVK